MNDYNNNTLLVANNNLPLNRQVNIDDTITPTTNLLTDIKPQQAQLLPQMQQPPTQTPQPPPQASLKQSPAQEYLQLQLDQPLHTLQQTQQNTNLEQQNQQQAQQQVVSSTPKPRGRRKKIRTEPIRPVCPQCEKPFSNQSALTKHMLTHSDVRKFECPQCPKAFKRHDHLTGHMQTHSNRKPFNCTIQGCDKTYCDARSLRRHKENIHHIITPKENNNSNNHNNTNIGNTNITNTNISNNNNNNNTTTTTTTTNGSTLTNGPITNSNSNSNNISNSHNNLHANNNATLTSNSNSIIVTNSTANTNTNLNTNNISSISNKPAYTTNHQCQINGNGGLINLQQPPHSARVYGFNPPANPHYHHQLPHSADAFSSQSYFSFSPTAHDTNNGVCLSHEDSYSASYINNNQTNNFSHPAEPARYHQHPWSADCASSSLTHFFPPTTHETNHCLTQDLDSPYIDSYATSHHNGLTSAPPDAGYHQTPHSAGYVSSTQPHFIFAPIMHESGPSSIADSGLCLNHDDVYSGCNYVTADNVSEYSSSTQSHFSQSESHLFRRRMQRFNTDSRCPVNLNKL